MMLSIMLVLVGPSLAMYFLSCSLIGTNPHGKTHMSTHAKKKSKLYQSEIDTRRKEDNNNEANGGCDGTLLYIASPIHGLCSFVHCLVNM